MPRSAKETDADERNALADRTLVVSGGSHGIGLAIAVAAAKGANVVRCIPSHRGPVHRLSESEVAVGM